MKETRHFTGLNLKDEKWSWSDLAHEIVDQYSRPDVEELANLLFQYLLTNEMKKGIREPTRKGGGK